MLVDRAIIIRRPTHELSKQYAQTCVESCEKVGLKWEFLDAVEGLEPLAAYHHVGVSKISCSPNKGNANCHASHILCWKRIIELDKCCIIFEHDALILANVSKLDIPDDTVVTLGNRVQERDGYQPIGNPDKVVRIKKSIGGHAYALTPKSATYLYDDAINKGITMGVDRWLFMQNACGLPLCMAEPPPCVCWDRPSTMPERRGRTYNAQVYSESKTDGWIKGIENAKLTRHG